jgi:DNA invertase Pin-like site-specific DNA recombinase
MTIPNTAQRAPISAAEYVRASTNLQKYSTENQSEMNHNYAARHGMRIVRTYADEGKSGLTLRRRPALKKLIADVQGGRADFRAVLVYDVSRWGRFQDADESGYYEHICKRAGIRIHYCAEPFENDGNLFGAIVKSIKRAMAAEYSRELSAKTFAGQANLARLGFRRGSSPPYGTRRLLVDSSGAPKGILGSGEYKNLQNDRIILVAGPAEEIRIVRRIFSAFVEERKSESAIAAELNGEGVASGLPRPWTYARIRYLLRNEIYVGIDIWNRTSAKLGGRKRRNDPDQWMRRESRFPAMIERAAFEAAHAIMRAREEPFPKDKLLESFRVLLHKHGFLDQRLIAAAGGLPSARRLHELFGGMGQIRKMIGAKPRPGPPWRLTDDELLTALQHLLRRRGRLSRVVINKSRDLPHASVYESRFGSLLGAYRRIGYETGRGSTLSDQQVLDALRLLRHRHGYLSTRLVERSATTPSVFVYRVRFGSLRRAYELICYRGTHWTQQTDQATEKCHASATTRRQRSRRRATIDPGGAISS